MKNNGIKHIYLAPYHSATNGLAERSVQTFKEQMKHLPIGSVDECLARFLFWYCLTPHSTTGVVPAELLLGQHPRSKLDLLKPKLSETVEPKVQAQKRNYNLKTRLRAFEKDDSVYVKDFPNSKKWVTEDVTSFKNLECVSYFIGTSNCLMLLPV